MKKYFFCGLLSIFSLINASTVNGQFLNDQVTGRPIVLKTYTDIEGSPYLFDDWTTGIAKLSNGETYKNNLYLKYNLLSGELYFKGKDGEALTFVVPVTEFIINYSENDKAKQRHYKNGFIDIPGTTEADFFEILVEGTVELLKKEIANVAESKEFNSATIVKKFEKNSRYYIIQNKNILQIRRDKITILKALNNKIEIDKYIKDKKLKFKTDQELVDLINYYNSL